MWYILSVFFSSKCSLFHNSIVFGSCFIYILYTGYAKLKKNNSGAKRLRNYTVNSGRTALLTSKCFILYIYSTNIGTEYFKHGIYCLFFFLFKMQFVS